MKKAFLVIMMLLAMKCIVAESITLLRNYQQDDYDIEMRTDGTAVILAANPDFIDSSPIGAPSLPCDVIWIAVPPNSTFNNISYSILSQEAIGVYDVFPSQPARVMSDTSRVRLILSGIDSPLIYLLSQIS
jgi:hypothetical protein